LTVFNSTQLFFLFILKHCASKSVGRKNFRGKETKETPRLRNSNNKPPSILSVPG